MTERNKKYRKKNSSKTRTIVETNVMEGEKINIEHREVLCQFFSVFPLTVTFRYAYTYQSKHSENYSDLVERAHKDEAKLESEACWVENREGSLCRWNQHTEKYRT